MRVSPTAEGCDTLSAVVRWMSLWQCGDALQSPMYDVDSFFFSFLASCGRCNDTIPSS